MDSKRLILAYIVACTMMLFSTVQLQADTPEGQSTASMFEFDETRMNDQLQPAVELESYLNDHPEVSMTHLEGQGFSAINKGFDNRTFSAGFDFDDMEWGAFAWGFCCWPVGFFTVAINDETTKDEKASYWIGVVVSAVVGGLAGGVGATVN